MNSTANLVIVLTAWIARLAAPGLDKPIAATAYFYHHDAVLGTSADLTFITASAADAARAERVALAETERLRLILSSWDSNSEVSQLYSRGTAAHPSPELIAVLAEYTAWNTRSGRAYSARIGELTTLWQSAAARGTVPDSASVARVVQEVNAPAWRVDAVSNTITALTSHRIDLNSLGKGFIIDRVLARVRDSVPSLQGAMVNIGGDIHVWGNAPAGAAWHIAVANPHSHADNAAPLTTLAVHDAAVSSSGDYQRGLVISNKHYSHIFDPRTGYPVDKVSGVTVVARDNATANALATTLSVLTPELGVALVRTIPGASAMLVTSNGDVIRTPGFASLELPQAPVTTLSAATFTASLAIDVTPTERNRHAPYVAVWITDTAGHQVRTLAFWGDKPKYQREMTRWFGANQDNGALIDAVTRATRPAGKYSLDWDGLDQKGVAVPAGAYLFWLEVAFEDGAHSAKSVAITCGSAHAAGTIPGAAAFTGAEIACDPAAH